MQQVLTYGVRRTPFLLAAACVCSLGATRVEAQGYVGPTGRLADTRSGHTATLLPNGLVLVAGGSGNGGYRLRAELYDPANGTWTNTGSLVAARYYHAATLLPSGKVLVAGGSVNNVSISSAELYDPASGTWTATGSLAVARVAETATLLPNGKVLVAGGYAASLPAYLPLSSAEVYDPATGTWTATGSLAAARGFSTATLLSSGKVLVAGGWDGSTTLGSAQLYDPANGTWTNIGSLVAPRYSNSATLLPNGKVLVAGGYDDIGNSPFTAELFDPASGTWTATGSLANFHGGPTATLLPSGGVLVADGTTGELYDPASGTWTAAGSLSVNRDDHTATLLPSGLVLFAGGYNGAYISSAEVFHPASGAWTATGTLLAARDSQTATVLPNGKVLAAGGATNGASLASAEQYDPANGTWTTTGSLAAARASHTATLLPGGKVLVAGGVAANVALTSAALYDPASGTWTAAGALTVARHRHTATLLPNGRVLALGGYGAGGLGLASAELYDPASGTWTATGSPVGAGYAHAAVLLPSGKVLTVGGYRSGYLTSAELYDPTSETWTIQNSLAVARLGLTGTVLPNGKVLVAGGENRGQFLPSAELFDPATGTWTATGSLTTGRRYHTATLLPNGKVLVVGGETGFATYATTAEIYDPAAGTWTAGGSLTTQRASHTTTLLPNGALLVAGGYGGTSVVGAELLSLTFGHARPALTSSAPASIAYGVPLQVTGTGLGNRWEASGGGRQSSAVNYPLFSMRSVQSGLTSWLIPDARPNFSDDPMTVTISSLPPTLVPGWHYLTAITAGVPSSSRLVEVACSIQVGAPVMVVPAGPAGVEIGASATFAVSAQGAQGYQWQVLTAAGWQDIPGAQATSYTTPPVSGSDSGSEYRVVVRNGCTSAASASITLIVADNTPPTANVVSPAGGEYWLLSDPGAPTPSTQTVTWSMADNVRVCKVDLALLYSNDGGTTYSAAPAGGGLPASFGPGGVCAYPGEATTSLLFTIPTAPPSGSSGSLYKIRVTVTDHVGLQATVESANPFYIVRANPDSVRTLILSNLARMQGSTATLAGKLQELASNPKVQGIVVDLGGVTALSSLYATWDADLANPDKANDVLFATNGLHDYLRSLLQAYTGVKHVILVGDDPVIPFARIADHTTLLSESSYPDGANLTPDGTTVGQALAANKYLSDDPLAVMDPVQSNQLSGNLYIPDLAIGRLVETPAQITQAIATFISQDGVLDLSTLNPSTGHKVLVTGYDFLLDSAKRARERWKTALGVCTTCDSDPAPVDGSLIGETWGLGAVNLRVDALQTRLCGNGGVPYALMSLSGHATHFEEGVPGTDPFDIVGLDASTLAGPNACGAGVPLDLSGAVVYAVGCHGGLPVAGSDPADHPQDLPETLLSRGVGAYVANTGYGWGLRNGIGYGERLEELLTEELTKGGTIVVGDAVKRAKQRYYLETPRYDSYDEKSLMQWTLFGLPMYAIKTGIPIGSRPSLVTGSAPTAAERPAYEEIGGVVVERTAGAAATQPDYLTQLNLHFSFTAPGLYTKWTAAGDKVLPITLPCPDPNGCYYTLNGLADRATGAGDLPIQPYLIYDSRLAGTSQHGVLWKGGVYDEETNWVPVVGELVSNGGDGSDHGSAPRLMFTRPTAPRLIPGLDPSTCRPSDLELNSLTIPAGEAVKDQDADPSYTIERHYRTIDLEALYFNNTLTPGQNCDRAGPALGVGPFGGAYHQADGASITWAVPASDASGVWRVLVVVNDNSTSGGQGGWSPLDLTDNGSGTWVGSEAFGATPRVTYVIQAVDNRGNVTWLDYVAAQPPASGVPLGVPRPVDVGIGAPVGPTIASLTPGRGPVGLSVRIVGANLSGATDVTFGGISAAITSNTATLITAVVPAGAVTGTVIVTTPVGTASSATAFAVTPPPKLSITDVRVREGNSGQRNAIFRVTLSAPAGQVVTVDYATSNGTATGNDYVMTSGTLTFRPFARARTISVPILGDIFAEPTKAFFVTLSNATNAAIARAEGRGTIIDDDRP